MKERETVLAPPKKSGTKFESGVAAIMKRAFKVADKAPQERTEDGWKAIREAADRDGDAYTEAIGRLLAQGRVMANRDYHFDAMDAVVYAAQGDGFEFTFKPFK